MSLENDRNFTQKGCPIFPTVGPVQKASQGTWNAYSCRNALKFEVALSGGTSVFLRRSNCKFVAPKCLVHLLDHVTEDRAI